MRCGAADAWRARGAVNAGRAFVVGGKRRRRVERVIREQPSREAAAAADVPVFRSRASVTRDARPKGGGRRAVSNRTCDSGVAETVDVRARNYYARASRFYFFFSSFFALSINVAESHVTFFSLPKKSATTVRRRRRRRRRSFRVSETNYRRVLLLSFLPLSRETVIDKAKT